MSYLPALPYRFLLFGLLSLAQAGAQEDNFDDANDDGWERFDPIGLIVMAPIATFELPGGAYRISTGVSPSPGSLGPARAGSFRPDVVNTGSSFFISVDIPAYDAGLEQAFGMFALTQGTPSPGGTDAYACTFQPITNDIQISLIVDENIAAQLSNIDLAPGTAGSALRLTFSGNAGLMEANVYNLDDLSTALATATAYDTTYTSGTSGLIVTNNQADGSGRADATFDNFVSRASDLPPLTISPAGVRFPDWTTGYQLRSSDDLQNWTPLLPGQLVHSDGFFVHNPTQSGRSFFRLEGEGFKQQGVARIPNPSFEAVTATLGSAVGYISIADEITGWTSNGAPTLGLNPIGNGERTFLEDAEIPHGSRVAFIQSSNMLAARLDTTISGLKPGTSYRVTFRANTRATTANTDASWSLNGEAFVSFSADPGVGEYLLISGEFEADAETAPLMIMNQTQDDSTLLIDDFEIVELD